MLAEYRTRRDYVVGRLRAIAGVNIAEPKGAFYAYPNISAGIPQRDRLRRCSFPKSCSPKRMWRWCPARRSEPTSTFASPTRRP